MQDKDAGDDADISDIFTPSTPPLTRSQTRERETEREREGKSETERKREDKKSNLPQEHSFINILLSFPRLTKNLRAGRLLRHALCTTTPLTSEHTHSGVTHSCTKAIESGTHPTPLLLFTLLLHLCKMWEYQLSLS
jgi:hypothetical protein